ncbi:hypothetical protein GJW-30_1_02708 [Variibacter gotjawalensis]|uniref:YbjN domain-containing protein n=1 Tax=Variibacter gotjawalensis TaxID=1333996 RepID=A0A0S3PW96_9BRAD|nr:YbjN domain-containing protein [Variibacter gotjawalensis]NIK45998.1 hypothetical protein [Variibacter gotjawalensis]RZS47916.1 putative sensory transduction regulator [Variibacter gotjawalensis]BAT60172.1 hypothetical protein GJW-30_1_02708 [Variibacter gotjawalensis]
MRSYASLAAVLGLCLFASPLVAQPQIQQPSSPGQPAQQPAAGGGALINNVTPEQTAEVLKAAGYSDVEVYTAQSGTKHASGKTQGILVSAIHQNCNEGSCAVVVFFVNFGKQDSVDAAYMNAWHNEKLYSRLYLNNGNLFFTWSVFLGDTSMSHLRRSAAIYSNLLKDLQTFKPSSAN